MGGSRSVVGSNVWRMRQRLFLLAGCLVLIASLSVASSGIGQGAPPRLTIAGGPGTSAWPGVGARVDEDAYLTVIAVTRGLSNFPTEVLFPANPADSGLVRAGEQVRLRSLNDGELVHLVSMGEAPIITGFASRTPPNRSGFAVNKRWGKALYLETDSSTPEELAKELAQILFGSADAVYDVAIRGVGRPLTSLRSMAFSGNAPVCGVFGAGYSVFGRLGAGSVRYGYGYNNGDLPYSAFGGRFNPIMLFDVSFGFPYAINSALYNSFSAFTYGYNYADAGGCELYRVAWYSGNDPDLAYFYRGPGTRRTRPQPMGSDTVTSPTDSSSTMPRPRNGRGLPFIDPTRATGVSGDRIRAIASADSGRGGRRLHARTMLGDLLEVRDRSAFGEGRRVSDWDIGASGRRSQPSNNENSSRNGGVVDETRNARYRNERDVARQTPASGASEHEQVRSRPTERSMPPESRRSEPVERAIPTPVAGSGSGAPIVPIKH